MKQMEQREQMESGVPRAFAQTATTLVRDIANYHFADDRYAMQWHGLKRQLGFDPFTSAEQGPLLNQFLHALTHALENYQHIGGAYLQILEQAKQELGQNRLNILNAAAWEQNVMTLGNDIGNIEIQLSDGLEKFGKDSNLRELLNKIANCCSSAYLSHQADIITHLVEFVRTNGAGIEDLRSYLKTEQQLIATMISESLQSYEELSQAPNRHQPRAFQELDKEYAKLCAAELLSPLKCCVDLHAQLPGAAQRQSDESYQMIDTYEMLLGEMEQLNI